MNDASATATDEKLVELYKRFQKARRLLPIIAPTAQYDDFINRGKYQGECLAVALLSQEHILAIANSVNRFWDYVHRMAAWGEVFRSASEEEKFAAFFEFLSPIADQCLAAPYAIKQKMIKSVCQISHQSMRFTKSDFREDALGKDKDLNFKDAEKMASNFSAWPTLCGALSKLNDRTFEIDSDDYRARLNHGFPRHIEFGQPMTVERERKSSTETVYALKMLPPLRIDNLVPLLSSQYRAALDCYNSYLELIKEQHELWPKIGGSADSAHPGLSFIF